YLRAEQLAVAIPILREIVRAHPRSDVAEFAANLLLDSYNRLQQFDQLVAFANELANDPSFLRDRDDLADVVRTIQGQAARRHAETLERAAHESKELDQYALAGAAYLAIYNANPEATDNDEVLYNAGVCFEDGRSIGVAIQMYSLLKKYYPNSKITARATARLGKAFGDIAFYDRAAEELEKYAAKYAGEKDAHDAMSDAVFYRKGLGDDAKAIEDTKYYIRTFGTKKPAEAANAHFSLVSIYEKQGDKEAVIKHLREYIRSHGGKGGADKRVIAHAKIGQILFEQSCPVKQVDGSCVKITRERAVVTKKVKKKKGKEVYTPPKQCGPDSHIKLTVVKRDAGKLRQALTEFAAAGKDFGKVSEKDDNAAGARYYYALGKNYEADVEFEKYLDIKFPENLNFGDGLPENKKKNEELTKKSKKRFEDWLASKGKSAESANKKYESVLGIKDNANSIAAAARLGQITQNFADQLFTAEIPKDVRASKMIDGYDIAQDKVDAYCDALTTAAEPLAEKSLAAYGICLSKSTELGWFSEWSKLCERELGQIKPEEYPTASELRGDSDLTAPVIAIEPPAKLD
ncbi:MAG TPA: hypothetical protein VIV11_28255, partial [Kofleriaceae bacterium]